MAIVSVGVLKNSPSRAMDVSCGAPDCQQNHTTYPVEDVVIIPEGVPREETDDWDEGLLERMLEEKKLAASPTVIYPTMLGLWWEGVCDN